MYLLNLSLAQFLTIFGSVSALAVALYLLDRSRHRQVVSTLRFWVAAGQPAVAARRRRIQQPWSLILQLAGMALLTLAMAQLRWGAPALAGRDHVLILETSAWMAARSGNRTLMDLARDRARQYLRALPARDRVMLVRADALATPATAFEPDRRKLEAAIAASQPGATALDLDQALAFARHIQSQEGRRAGEIAVVATGRTAGRDPGAPPPPRNLRVLLVPDAIENCGLRKVGARRSATDPGLWEIYVSARNYGTVARTVTLSLDFGPPGEAGKVAAGSRRLLLPPGGDAEASFEYRTAAAGILGASLSPHDAFSADDRVSLDLPPLAVLPVTVYSNEPDLLRPVLSATPRVAAVYRKPEEYRTDDRGLVILDRFIPPQRPAADSIWIDPPAQGSPVPIRCTVEQAPFERWDTGNPVAAGLRAKDFKLEKASVFETAPTDLRIGEVAAGPVIVARPGNPKMAVFGFHPALSGMRYELATPLLFANLLRWVSPEIFRQWEIAGGSAGTVNLQLDPDTAPANVKVISEDGSPVPFTVHEGTLNFFAGRPGGVRVLAGDREYVYSLTLPQLWDSQWEPPAAARRGLPRWQPVVEGSRDLWPWLAIAGGLGLLLEWLLYGRFRRGSARRSGLLLKAGTMAAILLALAAPPIAVYRTKVAVAVLADTSASVSAEDLRTESALTSQVERARGRHWTRVIPFARVTRNAAPEEHPNDGWRLRRTAGAAGRSTDLESAIRDGAASLPAGMLPRLLLISDGNENLGSVARAIWQAQQLGVPIDTIPLAGRAQPGLRLNSIAIPGQVFSGERFTIDVTLESPASRRATIEMAADGKSIGSSQVELVPGPNRLRLNASVNAVGAIALAGRISAGDLGETRFENAVTLRRPRVLLVSRDPAASEQHLLRTLEANQFEVEPAPGGVPEKLDDYQLVVINNWDFRAIPAARKAALEDFVKQGGGLLWIAGERNVYVEKKGEEDPLERALPARLAPPRSPEGTAVVLVLDKSSSMEGRKIELARLAAIGVVENLRPIDLVGVLIFDNSFQWAVPIHKAEDRAFIEQLISGIVADGGTQIAPALTEAYRRILPQPAAYKHIVLLTDGISEEGDSFQLTRQALANHVTISTVGLGQDVNRPFLEKVASSADGKSYLLNDPSGLEQILLRDVEEHTGLTTVEKSIAPKIVKQAEILDGVGMENAPALRGYVRFEARPASDTILTAGGRDPLLVRWQYGLGRAAVFTSDAKNRWAVNWVTWPGFDRLWANIFRDILPRASQTETAADFDRASNELVVDYHFLLSQDAPPPDIFVFGPNGFRAPLKVGKVAAGHYRGRLAIGQNQGLFRVRPLAESRAFPEVGFYRQEDELREYGNNETLLRQVAAATGGRFNPAPREVFDAGGRSIRSTMELWPGLLALAIALNLAELILRKWKGLKLT
ncbi:MAG: VWA domain-containing protein [Bryobacteraceae bacterium]|jgi:uncharacterized membrane protein